MRKVIWTITTLGIIGCGSAAQAGNASKEEGIGFGTGAIVGAAAGGPVGFILGAAIGAKLGDNWHRKNDTIDSLNVASRDADITVRALRADVDSLSRNLDSAQSELNRLEQEAHPQLVSLMQAGVDLDLLFRTDESSLLPDTEARLTELGLRLASMPDIQVHLDGFADERGDETYNQRLSEERVAHVRGILVAAGMDPSRISEVAHGEVIASEASEDNYALERRVSLKVFIVPDRSVAANQ